MKKILFLTAVLATPLAAEAPMSAADFDSYTQGKTLYFGTNGFRYGVEEYLPDRRVRWSFLDGQCKDGFWYEDAGQICFVYEDNPSPQCWSFFDRGGHLGARFETGNDLTELYEIEGDGEMICLGPEVGV